MNSTCALFNPVKVNIPICLIIWLQSPGVPVTLFRLLLACEIVSLYLTLCDATETRLPLCCKALNSWCRILMIRSAIPFSSRVHSWYNSLCGKLNGCWEIFLAKNTGNFWEWMFTYLSFRIVATIDAPWMGGFEYIGLITSFSWLSTLRATSDDRQIYIIFAGQ